VFDEAYHDGPLKRALLRFNKAEDDWLVRIKTLLRERRTIFLSQNRDGSV
jgi:hypothetical protein